jgi:hypothetical protein
VLGWEPIVANGLEPVSNCSEGDWAGVGWAHFLFGLDTRIGGLVWVGLHVLRHGGLVSVSGPASGLVWWGWE